MDEAMTDEIDFDMAKVVRKYGVIHPAMRRWLHEQIDEQGPYRAAIYEVVCQAITEIAQPGRSGNPLANAIGYLSDCFADDFRRKERT